MVRPRDKLEWDELLATLDARDLDIIESYYFFRFTDKAIGQRYKRSHTWARITRKKILRKLYYELTTVDNKEEEFLPDIYLVEQFFQQAKRAISIHKLRQERIEENRKRRVALERRGQRQRMEWDTIKRQSKPKKPYHPGVGHRSPRGEAPPPQYRYTPEGGWVPAFKYTADGWVKVEDEDTASRHPTPEP